MRLKAGRNKKKCETAIGCWVESRVNQTDPLPNLVWLKGGEEKVRISPKKIFYPPCKS